MLILLLLHALLVSVAAAIDAGIGFSFGTEQWSHPRVTFSSSASRESLRNLQATGATGIRLLVTAYVDDVYNTTIHGISNSTSSPYATATLNDISSFISYCHQLNLSVVLQAYVDINWDVPANAQLHAWYVANSTSRNAIGSGIASDADWDAFFQSYSAFLLPLAAAAETEGVAVLSLGDELDIVWTTQEMRMRVLIAAVRAQYKGRLTAVSNGRTLSSIGWWDAVDYIGHNALWPLGSAYSPIGTPPAVADLINAWAPITALLAATSAANGGKPVLVTAAGTQSKVNCHIRPWGSGAPTVVDGNDQGDVSAWPVAYDIGCQANVYNATLTALLSQSWLAGLYFWRWNADDSAGGLSDNDFTPHGKPAEGVFRAFMSGGAVGMDPTNGDNGKDSIISALSRNVRSMTSALREEKLRRWGGGEALSTSPQPPSVPFTGWRGFVFGGPDEWSSPFYRLNSTGARISLANMASLGANAVQLVVQWYVTDGNSTGMYPITDLTNPLATSTDEELLAFIAYAKDELHMTVALSPMIDPDWSLPAQFGCRSPPSGDANCFWRGSIGSSWPSNESSCAGLADWTAWHENYAEFMLHYATLAQASGGGVDSLIIAHELMVASRYCAAEWSALIASVRATYTTGKLAVAFGMDGNGNQEEYTWMSELDWMGIECYLGSTAPPPSLSYQDASFADITAGFERGAATVSAFSAKVGGLKIACTEGGWLSAPWASETGWGNQLDQSDASIFPLATWGPSQALAYEAFLTVFEAQAWYLGSFLWLFRADPTAGGISDNSPTPWGKEAAAAIALIWSTSNVSDVQ